MVDKKEISLPQPENIAKLVKSILYRFLLSLKKKQFVKKNQILKTFATNYARIKIKLCT